MGLWTKSRLIFNSFRNNAKASIRQVARQTGLSKSSVHRLGQAMARRNQHAESWFWETEAGRQWLIRLVVAVLYTFGLKRGVGAETMSAFFACLHLAHHVGCSPTTLRAMMEQLECLILETTEAWEHEGLAQGQIGPIVGSVDETFLARMMLVFMDLLSGYVLLEEVADERTYETWYERVRARLEPMPTSVLYLVSDRAKALIKLAQTGLRCPSIPDLFHLLHELAKGYSLAIWRRLKTARQALSRAQAHLANCQAEGANETQIESAQAWVAAGEADVAHWQQVRDTYRGHLRAMSLQVHPWRLPDSAPQSSQEVEAKLAAEITALQELLEANGLAVKKKVLDKVRQQLAGLAAVIDLWWQTVRQDVHSQITLTPMWTTWVEAHLLPLMYWQDQVSRARGRQRKTQLAQGLEAVQATFEAHPFTAQLAPEVLAGWKAWAAEHAKTFQRASSAVEGRNGYLSQMHHNHRGLPKRRYEVWSALHNFDCRASDGSTPASRLFRRAFPDLFETVLSQIDELPRARKRQLATALSD
jgi:Family of unknown function (DUF6399)/IclR helix-turn-helix domain